MKIDVHLNHQVQIYGKGKTSLIFSLPKTSFRTAEVSSAILARSLKPELWVTIREFYRDEKNTIKSRIIQEIPAIK